MRIQFNVSLIGDDLEKYQAIKDSVSSPIFKAKDPEVIRMCLRFYYDTIIAPKLKTEQNDV